MTTSEPLDEVSDDARVIVTCWFPHGYQSSVEIGGIGAKSILSDRAGVAIDELVEAGVISAEKFNRYGRMRYIGTDRCSKLRLSLKDMERLGDWSPTQPNPDAPEDAKRKPLASLHLSSGGTNDHQ